MPKIITFLTFNEGAEDAAKFYVSIFKSSKITNVSHYPDVAVAPKRGGVMVVEFELQGQPYLALNGGPHFKFTDGISLTVSCDSQEEIDHYWTKLTEGGGEPGPCGWLKDRFGVSWQVNPSITGELLRAGDPARAKRVMEAVMKMSKIDIAAMVRAAAG